VNFGYIQVKEGRGAWEMSQPLQVKTFTEKPPLELAEVFIRTGEFFWNSGIFLWKASVIREEMERYIPDVTELFAGWETGIGDPAFVERAYAECPKISLDYGVMERTERAWLYPAKFGWADVDRL
jgi:mannose-1-phosphate guanylyltransferase